eukprot:CAMPEP_0174957456 /NCGR_PEP_ID=MMETSP0004_2-20121128/2081_1 /TAXON_ID=420556 /ORGANISM="Ochromonas sp., Strain CCMP1393" /LENGTH=312 /DNA_ID=CAMNT_0016205565 /DNA_START=36 /DNA_END=971 /DNA_ORIENTATION=-
MVTKTSSIPHTKNSKTAQMVNFFAGGLSGTISSTLTIPLEVVKTQLQSSGLGKGMNPMQVANQVLKVEGPKGFFKGLKPMLVGIIPTRAIYFWAYTASKHNLEPQFGNSAPNHLISAFVAGITSNTIMNPLWMVKTRFQIMADTSVGQRAFKNYKEVASAIWHEEGPPGFFKGITASYVGCFEGAIQWIAYERLKTMLSRPRSNEMQSFSSDSTMTHRTPSPLEYFLAAASSKCVAVLATYPHEVVRTRLREQATNGAFKYTGFMGTLRTIAKEEGRRGLYGGMGIHLLRSVPNAAVMFLSFELVSSWLARE